MTSRKSSSKRSNGVEKRSTAKTELKRKSPKARTAGAVAAPSDAPSVYLLSDEEIQRKAYALWEVRGRPYGSPDEDWYRAKEQLLPEESRISAG